MRDSQTPQKTFIGVDEAGYGPNLGPLTIAASVWSAPIDWTEELFSQQFSGQFSTQPWKPTASHIPLGDSKQLYGSKKSLASLEAGLFALSDNRFAASPERFGQFIEPLVTEYSSETKTPLGHEERAPWYALATSLKTPKDLPTDCIEPLQTKAQTALEQLNVRLLKLQVCVVSEKELNIQLNAGNTKGQILTRLTLQLVAKLIQQHTHQPLEVFCDRQGGRTDYLPALLHAMPDDWFQQSLKSRVRSSYIRTAKPPCEIHFSVGGDSFPPTGLASMLAKYTRERYMQAFNAFWEEQIPGIKPTAGYPVDAKRFAAAIASKANELKLGKAIWWRLK